MHVVYNAHNGVVNWHKFDGHRLGGFAAAYDEDEFARPSLGGGIGGYNGVAFGGLFFGERLHQEEFNPLQSFVLVGGNNCADNTCELHSLECFPVKVAAKTAVSVHVLPHFYMQLWDDNLANEMVARNGRS